MNSEPPIIEHNPNERREPKWLWKAIWIVIATFWLLQLRNGFVWDQIALGTLSGLFLGLWAMEKTGGEIPKSWRSKSARSR